MTQVDTKESAAKRDRSPAFPYIGLAKAIERIQILFDKTKRYEARVADIAKDWGLTPKSSSTDRNIAALLAYGLVEISGSGDARKIKLSDAGWRILDDKRPGVREALLAEAAVRPRIIADYKEFWRDGRPDDDHSLSQLKFEGGFTDEAARIFLRVFDETIRFTKSTESAKYPEKESDEASLAHAKVGDKIQWTSGGVDQFPQLGEVIAVSEDGEWLWVAESKTGIPMSEVQVISEAAAGAKLPPPPPPHVLAASAKPEIHAAAPGEREWLRGPLSKETSYRLIVSGNLGPKEIGKLIKLLKAQQAVLADEDEEEEEV